MRNIPFIPSNPILSAEDFVGRKKELSIGYESLMNGNNVFVSGYRGIGKTSFAAQLSYAIMGKPENLSLIDSYNPEAKQEGLVAHYACTTSTSLPDIVEGILTSLYRSLGKLQFKPKNLQIKGQLNLGVFKGEAKLDAEKLSLSNIKNIFIQQVEEILAIYGSSTLHKSIPIIFFIDEVDRLPMDIDLGSFIKTSKEELRFDGFTNISFLLAGQAGSIRKLIDDHKSLGRTLHHIFLPRMSKDESRSIIDKGEIKSGIVFDPDIKEMIISFSRGFPSIVQQLSYHSVVIDTDNYVDIIDFEEGLIHTIERLKEEEYVRPFLSVNKPIALNILSCLSSIEVEDLDMDSLVRLCKVSEDQLTGAINELESKDLITIDQNKNIHLNDRLIAVYLDLQSLRTKRPQDISDVAENLERKGYEPELVNDETNRYIDIIASKKLFWSSTLTFAVSCIFGTERVTVQTLERYLNKTKDFLSDKNVDELILLGREPLDKQAEKYTKKTKRIRYYTYKHFLSVRDLYL